MKAGTWNRAGFTLVELALVVLLVSLFSMLTLPTLTGLGQNELSGSARRIAGTVKYLFNESALDRLEYRLTYDLDRDTFGAKKLESNGELVAVTGTGRQQRLKGGVRFKDVQVTGRGKFSTGEVTTSIHPVGWLDETVVHLENDRGKALTLRINPFTGSTEVHEGYLEF
ncbi:MAG: hypothetical protein C0617_04420 [Desulfuromonas sp.]|nr:MAG: hypothetical protein C0617_04420 [Desulfuromonas sp.]